MSSVFGLSPTGFAAMQQQDVVADLRTKFQLAFGNNVNLADESVFGQLIAIFSEREALLWQLAEAVYVSQYPNGAEGVSVDNILALNNLQRLPARATVTNPSPLTQATGITLYGLVLYGSPGTTVPANSYISNGATPPLLFALDAPVVIGAAVNAVQLLFFSNAPTQGSYALSLVAPSGAVRTTAAIGYSAAATQATLSWGTAPTAGSWALSVGALTTAALPPAPTAAQLQAALQALAGLGSTTVAGSVAAGFTVSWPAAAYNPWLAAAPGYALDQPLQVQNSVQAALNQLVDPSTGKQPFADLVVIQQAGSLRLTFGAGTVPAGAVASAATPQALIKVASSSLQAGSVVTNVAVANSVAGAPAQGVGTATCLTTGAKAAAANSLATIATPLAGWAGVVNQLDCLVGAALETDQLALARRNQLLSAQANGPLPAIVEKVAQLQDVTAALGFQNLNGAAQQKLLFDLAPTSGSYTLLTGQGQTTPLAANTTAAQLRAALAALPGYANVLVTGSPTYGFVIDFNGAMGSQAQPMVQVSNTTNAAITAVYGRPPKSYEIVVQGGAPADIAAAIYASAPAGIACYGEPVARSTGGITAGQTQLSLISATNVTVGLGASGAGLQNGSMVTAVVGSLVTLSLPGLGTYSGAAYSFNNRVQLLDSNKTPQIIEFSRPQGIPIYIAVALVTDLYLTPGDATSGLNPTAQFTPASVPAIQAALVGIANGVPIGGLLVAQGSNGLVGAFNSTLGVVSYQLTFGTAPNPTNTANIRLQPGQAPNAQVFATTVSYT